jgi:hypothetical protein
MLHRTIYERMQMNRIVNFKGNRAKRHACASSNICRMPHPITVCSLANDQKHVHLAVTYLKCNSVRNINIPRNTNSYNVEHNVHALERNHNLFIYPGKTPYNSYNINIRFTTVRYYSLMTYNIFNYRITSLPVLSYHIFLHLKFRIVWNIGYLLHAFQKCTRSPVYSLSIDRICHMRLIPRLVLTF